MSILILKFWCVACAIFCILSLQTLVKERYEVVILVAEKNETDPTILLICKELSGFQLDKTELLLEDLRDKLIDHFNSMKFSFWKQRSLAPYKNSVLDRLRAGQYLIFNGLFCIHLKDEKEGISMRDILTQPVFFAFKNSTLDFVLMALLKAFDQVIVQMRGPPYSNCSEDNGRFLCLNECFKRHFRLSRYLYGGNETGPIHLKRVNRTIEKSEKSERSCFRECWRENCKIVQFIAASDMRDSGITRLEAHPKLSDFYYWVQYIGLVCSFANISLNQLTSLLIHFACSKVKRRRVRIALFCLEWAILFISLAYCGYLYISMFWEYKASERTPPSSKTSAVCQPKTAG